MKNTIIGIDLAKNVVQVHGVDEHRKAVHNTEWADTMQALGLMPSDTSQPGGKRTGQKMGDYVIPGRRFERATHALLESGFAISWLDRFPAHAPVRPNFEAPLAVSTAA